MSVVPDTISYEALALLLADKLAQLPLQQLEELAQEWRLAQQTRDSLVVEPPNLEPRHYWL